MATITFTAAELAAIAKQLAPLMPVAAPPVTVPPVVVPPAAGVFWVYRNGQFNWISDYSWNGKADYHDTSGQPQGGTADICFTIAAPNGGFQPYCIPSGTNGPGFDTSKYKYLVYDIKPTMANQIIATAFDANNDTPDGPGGGVSLVVPGSTKYGPAPVVGKWGSYKAPLADFGLTNPLVMKLTIADGTGQPSGTKFFIDNIGFE
jgi:hypothetical protein